MCSEHIHHSSHLPPHWVIHDISIYHVAWYCVVAYTDRGKQTQIALRLQQPDMSVLAVALCSLTVETLGTALIQMSPWCWSHATFPSLLPGKYQAYLEHAPSIPQAYQALCKAMHCEAEMPRHALHTWQGVGNAWTACILCAMDSGGGVQVNFEQDSIVSQANEYEVLQLLLADMRDRLTAYPGDRLMSMLAHQFIHTVYSHMTRHPCAHGVRTTQPFSHSCCDKPCTRSCCY